MKNKFAFFIFLFISCNPISFHHNNEMHEYYRTLWYRTGKQCYFDSSRKYGKLVNDALGINEKDLMYVDTTAVIQSNLDCK